MKEFIKQLSRTWIGVTGSIATVVLSNSIISALKGITTTKNRIYTNYCWCVIILDLQRILFKVEKFKAIYNL